MANVTLIIPTYRNPKYLDLCLKSAVENRVDSSNHILVIVDGYFEESREILEKYPDVLYLDLGENHGMQYALNAGVMQATTKYVFIINDDNVLPRRWDTRTMLEIDKLNIDGEELSVLTIDQFEPTGPGMFHFPVKDLGKTVEDFRYSDWLDYEDKWRDDKSTQLDGRIFPFVIEKKYYLACGGFDVFYNSPNICDWDFFLKLELLGFMFPRTRALRLYHFGSVATKKNAETEKFRSKEAQAFATYEWKWGTTPYNRPGTNSKIARDGHFRGFSI